MHALENRTRTSITQRIESQASVSSPTCRTRFKRKMSVDLSLSTCVDDSGQDDMQKGIHSLERGWDWGKASNQSNGSIPNIHPTDTPTTAPSVRATRHMLIDSRRACATTTSDDKRALLISGKKWRLQSKELSCR